MKILEVIRSVNPAGGGPIEGLKQIGTVLQQKGHTLHVVTLDDPAAPYLANFPLPVTALGPGPGSYGYNAQFVPWVRAHAPQYDVVLIDGIWQFHSLGTWKALRKLATPYAVFTHGMLDPWFRHRYPLKHLKKSLYWPWGDYRVCRDAAAVLFTSEEERILARQSFRLYEAKEVVVSYGTAGPGNHVEQQRTAFYQRYPELRDKRLAVFMSRIHPKKGCDLAIRAFAQTLARDTNWRLVLAGPDQVGWQAELQSLAGELSIADRVIWPGSVGGDLKWGLLRSAEVFLLPSHQENFGVVVAESLACGTPVLISNKVNIHREVTSSGAGFVAADDLGGTCDLLNSWTKLTLREQDEMRRNAQDCFHNRFEIQKAADLLLRALECIASKNDSSPASSRFTLSSALEDSAVVR